MFIFRNFDNADQIVLAGSIAALAALSAILWIWG